MSNALNLMFGEEMVYAAIQAVIDPELGLNIVDLGLIYEGEMGENGRITITMTLTTPGCPLHASFAEEIERVLWQSIPGLRGVTVNLVWTPPWNPAMISPEGRRQLGID
jgi:metal-sulfur cluster biosynthetic enzyme